MNIKRSFQISALVLGCVTTVHAQVAIEAWVQRYTGAGVGATDKGKSVMTDSEGSVIVAADSDDRVGGSDWITIKYSATGLPLWTNRYDGPAGKNDNVAAMAVSTNGTVFVTGSSAGAGNLLEYATLAYSGGGVPLWTNRYHGPGITNDQAYAITVSLNGTVLVTGSSASGAGPSTFDYATIAYTQAGVPLWTNRYDGPTSGTDVACAVAVSPSGIVFVSGYSYGIDYDYATIAYTESGVPLWTNRYDGPANGSDVTKALAVSPNGIVFVTGNSYGGGSSYDYATIAYTEAGGLLWTNRYNGPSNGYDDPASIAADVNDTVFVTGSSTVGGNTDYATIAYSGGGVPLWTNRYNGPANTGDQATAVKVGATGTVFVSGGSTKPYVYPDVFNDPDYATIAYSPAGVPLWTNRYDGPLNYSDSAVAMALGLNDTVFVTGSSSGRNDTFSDCATLAYSGAGMPLWTNRYNGPANGTGQACAVAVGADGTVFVAGRSLDTVVNPYDCATVAYSSTGVPLWTNRYDGVPAAVAVRADGTVIVAGVSGSEYLTIAYTATGALLWTNLYVGQGNTVSGVAVSPNGTVYVAGYQSAKVGAYATIAISSSGSLLWTNYFGTGYISRAAAVAVGANGTIYVTGYGEGLDPNGWNYLTVAYSEAGALLWYKQYSGPATSYNYSYGTAMAVDTNGNVFITGESAGLNSTDYATIAYSGAGVPLWTNRYNGPGNSNDAPVAVAVSPSGNVFVSGTSRNANNNYDYATIAYSNAGVPLWTNRYSELGSSATATALVVGHDGTVFVSGYSGASGFSDYVTVAYSEAGVPLSTNRYNGPANRNDVVPSKYCLAAAPDGVVVAGGSEVFSGVSDYVVLKYITTPISNPPDTTNAPPATITLLPSGDAQITFYGTSGSSYVLEHTFDLGSNSWTPVQTNTAAVNGTVPFTYLPLGPVNFWRIRPLP